MSELTEQFEEAIEDNLGDVDRIETRSCSSDLFSGTEYVFFGYFVPIRPLLQVVQQEDHRAIEEMSLANSENEDEEKVLNIFVAETDGVSHPAFV